MFSLQNPHDTRRRELGGLGNPVAAMIAKTAVPNDQNQSYKEKEI